MSRPRVPRLVDPTDPVFVAALGAVQDRPKIELHLHLEGSLRAATLTELAARHNALSPFAVPGWDVGFWTFDDLSGFLGQIDAPLRASLRTAEDWHRAAVECFADLLAQHVVYAEVSIAARLPGRPGTLPLQEILGAVEVARRASGLDLGLLVGLGRHSLAALGDGGAGVACELVDDVLRAREAGAGVVGVDLHGDELSMPDVTPLASAFEMARSAGLGIRVHAGEAAGPESVWNAVRVLRPARIGHGVRCVEDPELVRYLAEHQIALDLCPTSNVLTGGAVSIAAHPIRQLFDAGVAVTVSSDDPLAFETCIATEMALLHAYAGFSLAELDVLTATAAHHAFAGSDRFASLAPWTD